MLKESTTIEAKRINVRIEDRINGNPDFDRLGHIGYTAGEEYPYNAGWRGCPLGRSRTKDGAVQDLLTRANAESGTTFTMADVDITDGSKEGK